LTRTSDSGFEAAWEVSGLASSAGADLVTCIAGKACAGVANEQAIEVNLIEPINIYSLSNRAIKYGFLFVVLLFAGFFLFELVKRLRIHPAQYFLVGLAIAVFFLLLISLSEHFDFWIAYVVAATASTALITAYLTGVLGGLARALGFGLGLGILYSCLYGLLSSEDNALALGSILIFVILAAAMMITRKLDWYSLQESIGS
jgi:inner membrane protein